jgi:hypothetical protein
MNRPCLHCQRNTKQETRIYDKSKDAWAWWCSVCNRPTAVFIYKPQPERDVVKPYKEE